MMKRIIPVMLIALLAALTGPIQAQVGVDTYCGSLAEADCQLLTESDVAMQAVESKTFSLEANLDVSHIPDVPFEELNFNLTGEGSLATDVTSLPDLQPEDFLGDATAIFPQVADLLGAVAADMTLTLHLPEQLRQTLEQQGQALPDTLSLDLRMVDGVAYANLADMAQALPEAHIPRGWLGVDVAELYGTYLPEMMKDMPSTATFDMIPAITALMEPENLKQFVMLERVADSEFDGQVMAVFETHLDYVAMLEIPEFRDAVLASVGSDEAETALATIRAMYQGLNLVITKMISPEDKLVHSTEIKLDWDLSALAEMTSQTSAPQVSLDILVTEDSFNNAPAVTEPEAATMLPLQQLFPTSRRSS